MRFAWRGVVIALAVILLPAAAIYGYFYYDEAVGPRVVVLMYHRFCTTKEYETCRGEDCYYAIPIRRFEEQLRYLKDAGYRSISSDEAVSEVRGKSDFDHAVLITIDDGYESVRRAVPLLKKYGLRATLFVTADAGSRVFQNGSPRQRRLTNAELRALDPAVIDVQAHGLTHRPLSKLTDHELRLELSASKRVIERVTGRPVRCMAIPGNNYDARVLRFAKQAGYEAVFTSDPGSLNPGDDLVCLPRVNVAGYFGAEALATLLVPETMAERRFVRVLTQEPKDLLGGKVGTAVGGLFGRLIGFHTPTMKDLAIGVMCLGLLAAPKLTRRPTTATVFNAVVRGGQRLLGPVRRLFRGLVRKT